MMAIASHAPADAPPTRILTVGPGKSYAKPSEAIAAARDGDTIHIDSIGDYDNDVALIRASNLIIEGVGPGRARMKTDGRVYDRKGIWVFAEQAGNLTIRNIEFEGARVSDADGANGAGLRALGRNLTVDRCRFLNNQNGILGGFGTTTITHCEFDHNGLTGLTHNLYIGDQTGTLIFRFNYSHDSVIGHLLKSRAARNFIECNRLSDNTGAGSYELDLPNGGFADIIGNVIQQSEQSSNGTMLAYGEEGIINPGSELNLVHNTFINQRHTGTFVNAQKLPAGFRLVAKNNIFAGPGDPIVMSAGMPVIGGNILKSIAELRFKDPVKYDFDLMENSPACGAGVDAGKDSEGVSLSPVNQYVHPASSRKRSTQKSTDAGAFTRK